MLIIKKLLLLSIAFLFFGILITNAQSRTEPYDFPVKPGTIEWKQFKSHKEMVDACQIPVAVLKSLTTEAVAKTCLNYPLLKDLYFFNNIQTGFNLQKGSFNGFQELFSRKDASLELLKIYKLMNPTHIDQAGNDTLKGDFAFRFVAIEIIVSQTEILNTLDEKTKIELRKTAAEKYESKKALNGFGYLGASSSILVVGRILEKENKLQELKNNQTNHSIDRFLLTGTAENQEILEQILLVSKKQN